jgi:hypothetical protein
MIPYLDVTHTLQNSNQHEIIREPVVDRHPVSMEQDLLYY